MLKVFGAGDSNQIPEYLFQGPSDVYGAQNRSRSNSNPFDFVQRPEQSPQTQADFDLYAFNSIRSDSTYTPGLARLNQYSVVPYNVQTTYLPGPGSEHGSVSVYSNNRAPDSTYHTLSPSSLTAISQAEPQFNLDTNFSAEHLAVGDESQVSPGTKSKAKRSRPKAEKPQYPCDLEGCDEVFKSQSAFSCVILKTSTILLIYTGNINASTASLSFVNSQAVCASKASRLKMI
jgi:hypothetical protein